MLKPSIPALARVGSAVALLLVLAACTKGGQFDPTEVFSADMFDTKKKLQGQREPVFPNGVPGTTTGVPADLVKGYQAPPETENADAAAATGAAADNAAKPPPKPKPTPKHKVARAPGQPNNEAVWNQRPPPARTQISVGPNSGAAPQGSGGSQNGGSQSVWPAAPSTSQAAPAGQSVFPDPPAPAH
jgi:hypothetical protein